VRCKDYGRSSRTICLVLAWMVLAAAACRVSSVGPITFAVNYLPDLGTSDIMTAESCVVLRDVTPSDQRSEKSIVGERTIQDRSGRADIMVGGDIEPWLRSSIDRALKTAAIRRETSAQHIVRIGLAVLSVNEVAYRNAEYEGRVVLDVELVKAGGGDKPLWSFRATGTASNYGRPGSERNYQETVNHALDRAVADAINHSELRERLCQASRG
jgi:hypothetical protein